MLSTHNKERIYFIITILFISLQLNAQIADTITQKNNLKLKLNDNNLSHNNDSLNVVDLISEENHLFKIGLQAGPHSVNLNQYGTSFNRGIFFEAYLRYSLSSEIHSIISFNYWEAQIRESNTQLLEIQSETVISKAIKLELDFTLFKMYNIMLLFGPSISFENINIASFTVYSLGANLKLAAPLWDDRIGILMTIGYQKGSEIHEFEYSFFSYLLGIEINITNIL